MKTLLMTFFAALMFCLSLSADLVTPFFTYRARILTTKDNQPFQTGECKVRIRLYEDKSSTVPLWGMVTMARIHDGFIQVPIGLEKIDPYYNYQVTYENDVKLSDIISQGKAGYLGVSINDDPEQFPRHRLLHALKSNHARTAKRLSPYGSIGSLETQTIEAKSVTLPKIEVRGKLSVPLNSVRLEELRARKGHTVSVKNPAGGHFQVYGSGSPEHSSFRNLVRGQILIQQAKTSGVAVLISRDNLTVPCVSFFVEEGQRVLSPVECGGLVDFYFFKFGTGR